MTPTSIARFVTFLTLAAAPAFAQQPAPAADLARCQQVQQKFIDARARGDVDGMAALFAEDAIRVTPDGVLVGRDAIRANLQRVAAAGLRDFSSQRTSSRVEGSLLLDAGEWQARLGDRPLHGYYSVLLSCDGPQPLMLEETTNVAAPGK